MHHDRSLEKVKNFMILLKDVPNVYNNNWLAYINVHRGRRYFIFCDSKNGLVDILEYENSSSP